MPLTYKKKCGYIDEPQMIYNIQEDSLSKHLISRRLRKFYRIIWRDIVIYVFT